MCINLANEQMQVFYQQQVFQQEIADCLAEEVPPVEVTFPSGQEVVDVFMQVGKGSVMSLKVFLTLCIVSHVFVHLPVWMCGCCWFCWRSCNFLCVSVIFFRFYFCLNILILQQNKSDPRFRFEDKTTFV